MALFKSRYDELSFYVDGKRKKFQNGEYKTEDKKEIEVLEKLRDVERVEDEKSKPAADEVKPAPKAKPRSAAKSK